MTKTMMVACEDSAFNDLVLPALREKHEEFMFKELVKRSYNHKIMVRWMSRFSNYLDRFFTARQLLPTLSEVGLMCFRDLVYVEMKVNMKDAVNVWVDRGRQGEQIDRALLKNVLGIFVEMEWATQMHTKLTWRHSRVLGAAYDTYGGHECLEPLMTRGRRHRGSKKIHVWTTCSRPRIV